jgi:hypothetical protein
MRGSTVIPDWLVSDSFHEYQKVRLYLLLKI